MTTIFTAKNIMNAYRLARKSRKKKQEVYMFDQNLEFNLLKIRDELIAKTYKHSEYKRIILVDSKRRYIYSPRFRDHIVHHIAYAQIYSILDNRMTHTTFACRKGYGSHAGVLYLKKLIKKETRRLGDEKLYYLKIDFSKYFFSINHEMLKTKLKKVISDEEILYLLYMIIDSYKSPKTYDSLLRDYSYYIEEENKGLPIGGILSQICANFFLNDLDQYMKHTLKVRFVRYMDDIVLLGTRERLHEIRECIYDFSSSENLIINPKKLSFNLVSDGINFVGYRIKGREILVGKRIKKSFLKFCDNLDILRDKVHIINGSDAKRIESMYYSRNGCFKITTFGNNYVSKRGNTDFLRGANANNGANAGVFTLNLNNVAGNENRNIGFRCS